MGFVIVGILSQLCSHLCICVYKFTESQLNTNTAPSTSHLYVTKKRFRESLFVLAEISVLRPGRCS
jgi:hypothetical protein